MWKMELTLFSKGIWRIIYGSLINYICYMDGFVIENAVNKFLTYLLKSNLLYKRY